MTDGTLGPGGALAAALPGYEDRPQQRAAADAIAAALANDRALLVEAGTGTGKTLAYLIPALRSGRRIVVSTGTRTLQEQIARHDLPLCEQILPTPFSAVILKGIANYVCRRKLHEETAALLLPGLPVDPLDAMRADLERIRAWAADSPTGDRAEMTLLADEAPVWPRVTTTSEARLGPRCPFFERCFITQARRRADQADLVVVNHHLFFADLALRAAAPGSRVLPDYDAVIFDEAHQLEEVITEHFGVSVSTARLAALLRDARTLALRAAARRAAGRPDEAALDHLERTGADSFARVRRRLDGLDDGAEGARVPLPEDLFAAERRQSWFTLDAALEELAARAGGLAERSGDRPESEPSPDDDVREEAAAVARRAAALRDDLATVAEQSGRQRVYWGEARGRGLALHASPLDVAAVLREQLLDRVPACVFASATLTVAGSFGYTRERLGLQEDRVDALAIDSPFDYGTQALLYLARDLPLPPDDAFGPASRTRIAELLAISGGRAFVLFTSHRALREAERALRPRLPYPLLVQGEAPRSTLLERFRAGGNAVLLATGSFWEGVDVAGDALSMVILEKLPFSPPNDPLCAARAARVAERGGDPFHDYQVPQAALSLKQGFGRLIRRRDDRGIVALLDGRVLARGYGRAFLATLPPGLPRTASLEQARRWWTRTPPTATVPAAATAPAPAAAPLPEAAP